jgi:hypothetical protein
MRTAFAPFKAGWLLLAALLVLAGCASGGGGRLVKARPDIRVFDLLVDSDLDWARRRGPREEVWTIDGVPLNRFVVVSRIRKNEHVFLMGRERSRRPDGPWFRPGMRPDEVRDVVLDAFRDGGWSRVSATNLRPARYGAVDGLRFDAAMTADNGLNYQGTFGAVEYKGKLTLFFWLAPVDYYHGRDIAAVDRMFQSIQFVEK